MKKNDYMWEIFLSCFGLFMIVYAPVSENLILFVFSGLFFALLGILIIVYRKRYKK
ncbi:MAG: LPXTG cell wall anchor domain-containing protein [Anaerorhabdus sp.]